MSTDENTAEASTDETTAEGGTDETTVEASANETTANSTDRSLLSLQSVRAGYGNTTVIHDVNLSVDSGQIACLIGPNGSGKSTVMKSVYGFADVMAGSITFEGEEITGHSPQDNLRSGMSYVLQSPSVFPDMTVHENMLMGGFIFDDDDRAARRAEELYDEFPRLAERRGQDAGTLSGGERRLLELARAMIVEPKLMLLDEPSIGLEPSYIEQVFDRISDLNDAGITMLLVEQNAEKGLSVADRGYVLASGEIKHTGTGRELLENEEVGRLYLGG